jgi:hypothetical protein
VKPFRKNSEILINRADTAQFRGKLIEIAAAAPALSQ